ncbi:DNA starvation/stationary phase protection protein (plasmid) [Embleya sp. NBC_00888]|uniref:Dps family protein n=1 Tax=Embleya sp. NBC_00888 TaxID=2975960 RepID=UPI002F90A518|nr:DNA starvation/stationary phase protection protein [Embleya sp. NBC_00888]
MTTVTAARTPDARETTGEILQASLVDLLDLATTGKQIHWNVYGPGFRSLHLHLDEIVTAARRFADDLAERAATLGTSPDGRAITVAGGRAALLPGGRITVADALAALAVHYDVLLVGMRRRIHATTDPVTQDLLISVTAALEKQHWMLQAESPDHARETG